MDTNYILNKLTEATEDIENIYKAIEILITDEKYADLVDDLVAAEDEALAIRKRQGYIMTESVFKNSFPEVVLDEVVDALI